MNVSVNVTVGGHQVADFLPLNVTGSDSVSGCFASDIQPVERAIVSAASEGDFRAAAALQDLLFVVKPKPLLSVEDCAPTDPDEAAAFFVENGFVCIQQLFSAPDLQRIQAAWQRAQEPARAMWAQAKSMGKGASGLYWENQKEIGEALPGFPHGRLFFDIPVEQCFFAEAEQGDGDPILLDLIDPPKLVAVLHRIIGEDVVLCGMQPRTVPPEQEGGYTSWHSDSHAGVGWEQEQIGHGIAKRTVKAFICERAHCTALPSMLWCFVPHGERLSVLAGLY